MPFHYYLINIQAWFLKNFKDTLYYVLPVLVEDGFSAILFLAEFPKTAQLIVVKQKKFWE